MPKVRYDARRAKIVNAIDDCDHGFYNRHGALVNVLEAAGYNQATQQFDPQTLKAFCAVFDVQPETIGRWMREDRPLDRWDTFHEGDLVDWNRVFLAKEHEPDSGPLPSDEFGPGPFTVTEIVPIPVRVLTCGHYPEDPEHIFCNLHEYVEGDPQKTARQEAGHHQMVTVETTDGRTFTGPGSWFVPIQSSEWTLAHDGEGGCSYYFGGDFDFIDDEWVWDDDDWDADDLGRLVELADQILPQQAGVNITCRDCGEIYWSEDSHECDLLPAKHL